jgi:hypothetical protein
MRIAPQPLLGIFMMLISAFGTLESKKAPPVPAAKLVGVWVGFDDYGLSFTRFDLRPDFSGYVSEVGGPQGVYQIRNWRYDGYLLTVDLVPVSKDAETGAHVTGHTGMLVMNLVIRGKGWPHQVRLYPEKRFGDSRRETEQEINSIVK